MEMNDNFFYKRSLYMLNMLNLNLKKMKQRKIYTEGMTAIS